MLTVATLATHPLRNPDDTCVAQHRGSTYSMALALNLAMLLDDAAQARYAAIYGVAWLPVPPVGGESDEPVVVLDAARLERSVLATR